MSLRNPKECKLDMLGHSIIPLVSTGIFKKDKNSKRVGYSKIVWKSAEISHLPTECLGPPILKIFRSIKKSLHSP